MQWAEADPAVVLLVQIGSRARAEGAWGAAQADSDWDFQLATTEPARFADATWLGTLGLTPLVYVARPGRLGSADKVTAVFPAGVLDLVIIPATALRGAGIIPPGGFASYPPAARQALTDLSAVLRGGYRIRKGGAEFVALYESVTREVPPARLSDSAVRQVADGFVCDYLSTRQKLARGEWAAAQRWLHHQLAEANFRLLHEWRERQGLPSFPDARRLETLPGLRAADVTVAALPTAESLQPAVEAAAATLRGLVDSLLAGTWRWPDLGPLEPPEPQR